MTRKPPRAASRKPREFWINVWKTGQRFVHHNEADACPDFMRDHGGETIHVREVLRAPRRSTNRLAAGSSSDREKGGDK